MNNSDQVYKELIVELNELKKEDGVILSVATTMSTVIAERIFDKGLAADGQPIGSYSTKPISISRKRQSRKTKSTYFKEGYQEYKRQTGFDPNKVNLVDSGQLQADWSVIPLNNNTIGLGFKNELNSLKAEGNEKRFGKEIFAHGKEEDEIFDKVFQEELDRVFEK